MYKDSFISGIITAAGMGTRMNSDIPKLELKIKGKPIINYTVENLWKTKVFDEILLVTSESLIDEYKARFSNILNLKIILGGNSREESTYLGLKKLDNSCDIVVCHDGARPFVDKEIIIKSIESAIVKGSGIAGVPVKDTIKVVDKDVVVSTLPRHTLYQIQSPQTFKKDLILEAYDKLFGKITVTDDAGFLESLDKKTYVIDGDYKNIKITTQEDLLYAENYLEEL